MSTFLVGDPSPFSSWDSRSSSLESPPPFSSPEPSSSDTSSSSFLSFDGSFLGGGVGFVGENNDFFSKLVVFWLSHPDHAELDCATAENGETPAAAALNPKVFFAGCEAGAS